MNPQTVNKIMQQPQAFTTVEQQRRHMKERLAGAYRLFSKFGFDNGIAGHITMRDPEYQDCFWVNPFGLHFSQLKVSDLLLVDHGGKILEGKHTTYNSAAFAIHSRIHKARPDVVAAAHAHSTYGVAFSALGKLLDPISQDACVFYEDHALHTSFKGVVYDVEEGDTIARSLGNKKAMILQNHGLLTVGRSADEAAWWYIHMERCCHAQLLADAAGKTINADIEFARLTREQIGGEEMGWCAFQPLWDRISKEQPDLFN
jgi:ribulose-5-phosphate 4-epimerase/fuculose-1-phosphate aldolase